MPLKTLRLCSTDSQDLTKAMRHTNVIELNSPATERAQHRYPLEFNGGGGWGALSCVTPIVVPLTVL